MAKKDAGSVLEITLPPLDVRHISISVVGTAPLVTHKFAEKARKQIEDKQQQKAKRAHGKRDPEAEYLAAIHRTPDGKPGFPACGFKKAIVRAATDAGLKMSDMNRRFHVEGDIIPIISDKPFMRTDDVRISMKTAEIRYRPQFNNWKATFTIRFNAEVISPDIIMGLVERAGFGVGIGENRPATGGSWGTWELKKK